MNDDQHIMSASVEKTLVQHDRLIDGRTERDWLSFIARFASLINFYDHHNRHRGSWEPFILKDPVFLTASIAATSHRQLHSSYRNAGAWLDKLIQQNDTGPAAGEAVTKLFDTLIGVFLILRKWVYYMQLSPEEYPLKTFTLSQVRDNYSQYLWALLSLRKYLVQHSIIKATAAGNEDEIGLFDAVDGMIWKHRNETTPFWNLLELVYPPGRNKIADFVTSLKRTGDKLFDFLNSITGYAAREMEQLGSRKAKFPDTLLLRAFANILTIQQEQMNLITGKHLDFYYREVLKLKERNALPDHAFLCAALLQKSDITFLPAGTLFDAGIDEKNIPVSFAGQEDIILQPSAITGITTVSARKDGNKYRLFGRQVEDPGKVILADGHLRTWKTFGGDEPAAAVAQAFAIASPLFLLREGERSITLTLFFDAADPGSFDDVQFYLSTQKAWLPVDGKVIDKVTGDRGQLIQLTINITLGAGQLPVEAFVKDASLKDPGGLMSEWPLLKIGFLSWNEPGGPLILKSIKINVVVTGVKTLLLSNDLGPINPKAPWPVFGPAPLNNSNFIIGNNEVFSKPTDSLQLKLLWDKLPPDLADYYKEYNEWLNNDLAVPNERRSVFTKVAAWFKTILQKFMGWLLRLFKKEPLGRSSSNCPVFNNTSFTVDFSVLEKGLWKDVDAVKAKELAVTGNTISYTPYVTDNSCVCKPAVVNNILFSTSGTDCAITTDSNFVFFDRQNSMEAFTPDPFIQRSPLVYSGSNSAGFLRISLSGPGPGFGSAIYPSVLNGIALQNAWILYNSQPGEDFFGFKEKKQKPNFVEPAKLPLAPKLTSLELNYSSTQEYSFAGGPYDYPVQCFYYTPFYNYKIYDNNDAPQQAPAPMRFFYKEVIQPGGLCIFQPFQYNGIIFITLDQLIPSREINFYFELRRRSRSNIVDEPVRCCYLSDTGWKELAILSDTTYNFTCSGILKWIVPGDITPGDDPDPAKKYCFAIATPGDPAAKAETAFVSVNGVPVMRSLLPLSQFQGTVLPAGSITQPVKAIPSIAGLLQPFPSFGGRASESPGEMYIRVANRLATKDRVVTKMDVHRLIKEQFPVIYSSTTVFNKATNTVNVYAVGSTTNENETAGYIPFVNDEVLVMIRDMLSRRISPFYTVTTSNFNFMYLQVVMQISVSANSQRSPVSMISALRSYLSPWIKNEERKMNIDNMVLAPGETSSLKTGVAAFVKTMEGVTGVKSIQFKAWDISFGPQAPDANNATSEIFNSDNDFYLLIPALQHDITIVI